MNEYAQTPTCETGFWEPLHGGCPLCGPNGPCRDPEYEALIQANLARKEVRKAILAALICVAPLLLMALVFLLTGREDRGNTIWAGVCTVLLTGFTLYRHAQWRKGQ